MGIVAAIKKFDRKSQKFIIILTFPFLVALVVGLLAFGRLLYHMNNGLVYLAETNHLILVCRQYEKEFQLSRNLADTERFSSAYDDARNMIHQLGKISGFSDGETLLSLGHNLRSYHDTFFQVVELQKTIGLDENSGLRGGLRQAIHHAEALFIRSDLQVLMYRMLMCRRNEKDFLIRKDARYIDNFKTSFRELLAAAESTALTPTERSQTGMYLQLYARGFYDLAATMQVVGLNREHGLLARMGSEATNVEALLSRLKTTLRSQRARVFNYLLLLIIPLLVLIVHTTILLFKFMATNERLLKESETRKKTQAELNRSHEELELRVDERTAALTRSVQELEQRNMEIALLGELNDHLQVCQNQSETFPVIGLYGAKLFPATAGCLYLYKASRVFLEQVASWGENLYSEPVFNPEDCWSLRMGKTHRMYGDNRSIACHHRIDSKGHISICEPLSAQGEVIGMLHIQFSTAAVGPAATDPAVANAIPDRLVATLAENLAMALSNLSLREVLRLQSIRDPLTGLFNRRYMEETFERELGRVKRNKSNLTVIMFDVDHFKKYNDSYGHHAGDAVLSQIGKFLKTGVRSEDIPCRYGGEEFLLIMPGLSAEGALRRAESIRTGIFNLKIENKGQPLPNVTVSMGVAAFPTHGDSGEKIIQAADEALYRAKRNGRNRSCMAGTAFQKVKNIATGTQ